MKDTSCIHLVAHARADVTACCARPVAEVAWTSTKPNFATCRAWPKATGATLARRAARVEASASSYATPEPPRAPVQRRCGICRELGHRRETCPKRADAAADTQVVTRGAPKPEDDLGEGDGEPMGDLASSVTTPASTRTNRRPSPRRRGRERARTIRAKQRVRPRTIDARDLRSEVRQARAELRREADLARAAASAARRRAEEAEQEAREADQLARLRLPGRPKTRAECAAGPRPCPWFGCRYHLGIDVNPRNGSIKFNFPDRDLDELDETCALDVADRGRHSLDEVGAFMNIRRERVRQIEVGAGEKIRACIEADDRRWDGDDFADEDDDA